MNDAPTAGLTFATADDQTPVTFGDATAPHLLVVGATGTGKTVAVQSIAVAALEAGWDVCVIDTVRGAIDYRFARPWQFRDQTATTLADALVLVLSLRKTMLERHAASQRGHTPPPVLLIVDEMSSILAKVYGESETSGRQRDEIGKILARIVREGRSARIHVVLASQQIRVDDLRGLRSDLAVNTARLVMGNSTYGDRIAALRHAVASAPQHIRIGQGLFEPMTGDQQLIQVMPDPTSRLKPQMSSPAI